MILNTEENEGIVTYTVQCNRLNCKTYVNVTVSASGSFADARGLLQESLNNSGWLCTGREHYCKTCNIIHVNE